LRQDSPWREIDRVFFTSGNCMGCQLCRCG